MTKPKAPWLKYYGDIPETLEYPQGSMYEAIKFAYDTHLNGNGYTNCAYTFQGKKTYYPEFFKKIDNIAKSFKAIGIEEGDKVTICMPNAPQGIDSFYALNRISAVPAMIHPLSAPGEIKFYVILIYYSFKVLLIILLPLIVYFSYIVTHIPYRINIIFRWLFGS